MDPLSSKLLMNIAKKPKVRSGRVPRIVRMPESLHEKIKAMAKSSSKSTASLYEEIFGNFLTEINESQQPINYLFHRGVVRQIPFSLKEELVHAIKAVSKAQSVPETRIMFTAIVRFAEKNGWATY